MFGLLFDIVESVIEIPLVIVKEVVVPVAEVAVIVPLVAATVVAKEVVDSIT